ncbi:MAG: PAS domain S-box protein [Opitutaceae bacterium]
MEHPPLSSNFTRPNQRKVVVGFSVALVCLVVVGVVSFRAVGSLHEDTTLVAHTRQVIGQLDVLYSTTIEAQSGRRGFAMTGMDVFLKPYDAAVREIPVEVDHLRRLVADNPQQVERLNNLVSLIDAQLAFGRAVIEARRVDGFAAADALTRTLRGQQLHDQVALRVAEMKQVEDTLLVERQKRAARSVTLTRGIILAGGLLALGLGGIALATIRRDFAARLRAETALRQSENSLDVTLHSIGDAMLATDTDGRVTRLNRVAETLTGWTRDQALGRPIAEIFRIEHEHTGLPAVIPVDQVLSTGSTQALESHTVLIARDGSRRPIDDSAAPIRDRDGRIHGVVLVFRDVTAERAADARLAEVLEQLERERARLKFIFDSLPVGISLAVTQPTGTRTRLINDAHLKLCGFTREQADQPQAFQRITHPEDRQRQEELLRRLEDPRFGSYAMDKRYLRHDGSVVWVMIAVQRRKLADGSTEDLSLVVDITERKRAEEQIDRQNAHLRAVFESLPGLFLVLKPDFTIVTATDAYLQSTMTRREQILDRNLFDVFPDNPDDPAASGVRNLRTSLERVRQTGQSDIMAIQRYDVRGKDGGFEEKYWSPINSPVIGPNQAIEYIIHRVEDVTEFVRQKQARAPETSDALRDRMVQMEAEVFQSSQKLQQANHQLESANAELEAFSYSVSHDLRAPLRHIQGYAGMLAREASPLLSDTAKRYLKTVMDSSRQMGALIDDLLTFSKMGRTELRETRIEPSRLCELVRHELEFASAGRDVDWKIAEVPAVRGDPALIKQVLANLIGNALKYSRGRNPAVIEMGCAGLEDDQVVLFVRDNGAGFDMKYAHKLFGVFQRLHRTDEFEGTGIGLATVRRIVTRHGGRTWAEGVPQVGATFYFTLKSAENT